MRRSKLLPGLRCGAGRRRIITLQRTRSRLRRGGRWARGGVEGTVPHGEGGSGRGGRFAVGSDVGPFPHGKQALEMVLMGRYGMSNADVLRADMINGAKLLGWAGKIGELKAGYFADVVAVKGNPLEDLAATQRVSF